MSIHIQGNTLFLFGDVGDLGENESFNPSDVVAALGRIGPNKTITACINSGGGYAMDGMAIYNILSGYQGRVRIEVDGIAASAASLIVMAGAEVLMKAGSMLMIHDPSGWTVGTSDDHARTGESLDKMAQQYAAVYAKKCGASIGAVRAMMKAETWFNSDEAVRAGFADRAESQPSKMAASFDYRKYRHAPEQIARLQRRSSMVGNMEKVLERMGKSPEEQPSVVSHGQGQMAANMRKLLERSGKM